MPCSTNTMNTAADTRKTPLKMLTQPSHKKFCCPCMTPVNIGISRENNITSSSSHSAIGLDKCQLATICFWKHNVTAEPASQSNIVPSQAARMVLRNCRSRPVASAFAVCCVNTI